MVLGRVFCHHGTVLAVDHWPDDVPVPSFGPRMVCTGCGVVGADAAELDGEAGAANADRCAVERFDPLGMLSLGTTDGKR